MHRIFKYIRFSPGLLVLIILISACKREPVADHEADTGLSGSLFQNNVVKLDSSLFLNPVRTNGHVRFDLVGLPPSINPGDMVFYPGSGGFYGKVISASVTGSRMFMQLDASGLDRFFRSVSIQDTLSKNIVRSRTRIDPDSWNADTLGLEGVYLYNGFWQLKGLQVKWTEGKLYSQSSVGQFILSGQGSEPWFDRLRLDFNYSLDIAGELSIKTGSAMDASDSLLVEKTVYGPYVVNGFPVTYQIDTWLGFHAVTKRDTVLTIKLSGISKGNLSLSYNYWENWNLSQDNQDQSATIQSFTGPRFSGYLCEVFVSQTIKPCFCGEASLSLSNHYSALVSTDVVIPGWQSAQTVINQGIMLPSGEAFRQFIPGRLATNEALLFSETQNGELENQKPKAAFVINPPAGFTDTNFEFDASASNDLESPSETLTVRWDFDGDGHYDTEFNNNKLAYFKYLEPGVYQPSMEVSDPGGLTARAYTSVEVTLSSSAPVAFFTVTPESGRISDIFIFDAYKCYDAADGINQLKVRWDYNGDSIWDTSWSANKIEYNVYREVGKYLAKMEVKNTLGLTGSTTRIIHVAEANIKPTAFFTVDPEKGTTTTIFNFDASGCTDPEDPPVNLQVRWDWENDGIYDSDFRSIKTIQHNFPVSGTYTVVVEVIDTEHYGSTFAQVVKVSNPNTPPEADFTITPAKGKVNEVITFDASLSVDAEDSLDQLQVRWDCNNDDKYDTGFTTEKVYKRSFNLAGSYVIIVQVRDSGGLTDTRVRLLVIE